MIQGLYNIKIQEQSVKTQINDAQSKVKEDQSIFNGVSKDSGSVQTQLKLIEILLQLLQVLQGEKQAMPAENKVSLGGILDNIGKSSTSVDKKDDLQLEKKKSFKNVGDAKTTGKVGKLYPNGKYVMASPEIHAKHEASRPERLYGDAEKTHAGNTNDRHRAVWAAGKATYDQMAGANKGKALADPNGEVNSIRSNKYYTKEVQEFAYGGGSKKDMMKALYS